MRDGKLEKALYVVFTAEAITKLVALMFDVMLASLLAISDYAEWSALYMLVKLSPYFHFGALSYFNKRYPLVLGRRDHEKADVIFTWVGGIISYLAISIFFIFIFLFLLGFVSLRYFLLSSTVPLVLFFSLFQAKLRCDGRFLEYSIGSVMQSIFMLLLCFFLLDELGVEGILLSVALSYFVSNGYYYSKEHSFFFFNCKWTVVKRVLFLGAPSLLVAVSSFFVQFSDRVALIVVGSDKQLAYYGFYFLFAQVSIVFVNTLGKVLGPYVVFLHGARKVSSQSEANIGSVLEGNLKAVVMVACIFSVLVAIFFDDLASIYFTNYVDGRIGAICYVFVGANISLAMVIYPYLISLGKEYDLIIFNLFHCLMAALVVTVTVAYDQSITVFSLASLVVSFGLVAFFVVRFVKTAHLKALSALRWIVIMFCVAITQLAFVV